MLKKKIQPKKINEPDIIPVEAPKMETTVLPDMKPVKGTFTGNNPEETKNVTTVEDLK